MFCIRRASFSPGYISFKQLANWIYSYAAEDDDSLANLINQANEAYKKIETPLQEHLKNVHATLGIAV